ncbi:hypothetical protein QNA08_11500 [Chelatococcus sp. SYSU_G07232]|uniref:Uncharacterized protein n=1 Tax=Chelatococcus albus TaxID=3047466 RepID=A0ABT7AJ69_9HYPH|nr:hypothetical protein [Chelatococcus sp. SYSU_G07232]MDJ1158859.1 hypothetical protein [Chelatococcus sp. SYSU_G07232]
MRIDGSVILTIVASAVMAGFCVIAATMVGLLGFLGLGIVGLMGLLIAFNAEESADRLPDADLARRPVADGGLAPEPSSSRSYEERATRRECALMTGLTKLIGAAFAVVGIGGFFLYQI